MGRKRQADGGKRNRGRPARRMGDENVVVGYIRVSTDDQKLSPDAQRDTLERWCDGHDRGLVYVAEDLGVSGKAELDKRPGLLEAIAAVREHKAGCLLVVRLDRLSRDVGKGALLDSLLEREGARIMTCDGVGNDATAEGTLLKNMMSSIAQYEREIIALRTKVVLRLKKDRKQRYNCRAPYGYRWTEDGHMVEAPAEQKAIATICDLRAKGKTIAEISEHLNDRARAFPSRGTCWHPTTVYRIVCRHPQEG